MATQLIQRVLPSLDFPILSYINGIFGPDADPNDNPVESFIRPLLESETRPVVPEDEIERVCSELQAMWDKSTGGVGAAGAAASKNGAEPAKLDVALDMRRQELKSKRQAVTQVVDIASVVSSVALDAGRGERTVPFPKRSLVLMSRPPSSPCRSRPAKVRST